MDILDAERWRGRFQGALRKAEDPAGLHADLVAGIDHRRWVHLKDESGVPFHDFESFCRAAAPHGLGRKPELVRTFLVELLGSRQVARLTVAPSHQGVAAPPGAASRQNGGKSARETQRLRAIQERAPEPVRVLHDLAILSVEQAAWFGAKKPSAARKAAIDKFAQDTEIVLQDLGTERDGQSLARAKDRVLEVLPIPTPDRSEALMRRVGKLNPEELLQFLDQLGAWLVRHGHSRSDVSAGTGQIAAPLGAAVPLAPVTTPLAEVVSADDLSAEVDTAEAQVVSVEQLTDVRPPSELAQSDNQEKGPAISARQDDVAENEPGATNGRPWVSRAQHDNGHRPSDRPPDDAVNPETRERQPNLLVTMSLETLDAAGKMETPYIGR